MYILILFLPLLSSILSGFFGFYFSRQGSAFISTFCLILTWLLALFIFYEVCLCHSIVSIHIYNWILIQLYTIELGLLFDTLTSSMLIVVTTISMLVHLYSTAYMSHDPHLSRFMSYLSLFTFFMLILVTSSNFIQLFVGWEGVGLCSYLLINFWFTRILANKAALKAMIMNRIADVFFIISILIIFLTFKTTDYNIIFNIIPFIIKENYIIMNSSFNIITIIAFFLFIGAIGKSAQIGLHTWLPDAMEGPTPVSSLLHAATMVTAGVFLIIRCSIIFEYSESILILLIIFGGVTSIFAGIIAICVYDLKKIIAYSTCSQLGYMFFSCGLSNYYIAFFHLFNHAFFKALLFLSAGSLIHAFFDEQDMRRMGQLENSLPFTYICFIIGSLAIMGFPFLTGFYSKDLILEFAYSRFIIDSNFIYFLGITSAIFTSIYSIRLIFLVFSSYKESSGFYTIYKFLSNHEVEAPWQMFISMFVLAISSIFIGFIFSDIFLGNGQYFWSNSIIVLPCHFYFIDIEFIHPLIKNLPVILSLIALLFTEYFLNLVKIWPLKYFNKSLLYKCYLYKGWFIFNSFFYNAGFFNIIYNNIYIYILKISYISTNKYLDKGIFEYLGPFGFYKIFKYLHKNFQFYNYSIIFFVIFFLFISTSIIFILIILFYYNAIYIIINNLGLIVIILLITFFNFD